MSVQLRIARTVKVGGVPLTGNVQITGTALAVIDGAVNAGVVRSPFAITYTAASVLLSHALATNTVTVEVGGTNEQQSVTIGGGAAAGTFTLTYSAQTTAAIAFAATAAAVQTALENLSNIAVGDVTVTGSAGGPWTVEFKGNLGLQNVAAMTASAAGLTGGVPTVTIATPVPGVAASQTFTLYAGQALLWLTNDVSTNPLTVNSTVWSVSNSGPAQAGIQVNVLS